MTSAPALADFAGRWRVVRAIEDRLSAQSATFEGLAVFAEADRGLSYSEEGILTLGDGPAVTATRTYLWQAAGDRIAVLFPDGRPFHDFDPAAPGAVHHCAPDTYRVRYDFSRWPDWQAEWTVAGPRKDYTSVSRYARAE